MSLYCETKTNLLIYRVHCITINFIYTCIFIFNALFKAFKAIINMIKVKYWFCIFTSSLAKVFFLQKKLIVYSWLRKMVSMLDYFLIKLYCRLV